MKHRMLVTVQSNGDGSEQPDHRIADQAMELSRTHHGKAIFLAVGFVHPHDPMVAPQSDFQRDDLWKITLPLVSEGDLDDIPAARLRGITNANNPIGSFPENQKRMWQGYYASVSFMDSQVGRVVKELERLGIRDETTIIFTSDHGYHLGEHTHWQRKHA